MDLSGRHYSTALMLKECLGQRRIKIFRERHMFELPTSCDDEKISIKQSKVIFEVFAESNLEIDVKLSERHSMQLLFENPLFTTKASLSIEKVFINTDDVHIFTTNDASMHSTRSLDFLKAERANYENFVYPVNKVWITEIGSFKIIFPYNHDFAEAVQNEFSSLIKLLKVLPIVADRYVEHQRKQALERLTRMRFQLQLYSSEDQKRPIQQLQTQIRSLMSKVRLLEKDIHLISHARAEKGDSDQLKHEYEEVHKQIQECKEKLNVQSEELDMMFSCYKETQLSAMNKLATVRKNEPITIVRTNEICSKPAQWQLTDADSQIGIADLILSNFLYTKKSKSDDFVEHLLELGYIRMNNLIPRETYKEVLVPTEIQKDMPVDHHKVLRIFCREKPPVGCISVKEHFEINVVPITLAITRKFYSTMLKFCFPDRDTSETEGPVEEMDDGTGSISGSTTSIKSSASTLQSKKSMRSRKSIKDSAFYVKIEKDDVEKMKERAEKNKLFIYIQIPARVSYKGNKQKNFKDITEFSLVIPTFEYHNVTWTWLDLLLAMRSDSRRVILSQVSRHINDLDADKCSLNISFVGDQTKASNKSQPVDNCRW